MFAEVGTLLIGFALAVALYTAGAAFWGLHRHDDRWAESARRGLVATTGLLGLAFAGLLIAFATDHFELAYVAQHSSRALSGWLKLSAVWAGQEGSLLMWAGLQAAFAALAVSKPAEQVRPLAPWATVILSLTTAFFTGITLLFSNPYTATATVPADGLGLNPLLRHPGMIFHPPTLYLGYVGLAVPFAFALAALLTRQVEGWTAVARRWTLVAWFFLGLGLLLGARWAYDVLGWGGYWGWDPVENAGLMPWLTATALLHGGVMQEQRGSFKPWNFLLVIASFILVIFGTFATRSGLIQSVHAYARSNLGAYYLGFMALVLAGSLTVLLSRRALLSSQHPVESFLSRDGMFLLTLILFTTLTASVFIGSVLPTLTEALTGQAFEAGPAWFDRVTGPQFGALVLLIGVCPLLGQAAGALLKLRSRGLVALAGAALVPVAALLAGFTQPLSVLGFALIGLAGGTTLAEFGWDAAARSRATAEPFLNALVGLFGRQRRRYGGYLVHAGVVLMALGVVGTRMYPFERQVVLRPTEPYTVGDYTLVYEDLRQETAGDHLTNTAVVSVYRDGRYLVTLRPGLDQYPTTGQTMALPAVRVGWREDLYLILAGWERSGATATFKVVLNPLVNFLWLGGLIFLAGGAIAIWPGQVRRATTRREVIRQRLLNGAVTVIAALVLLGAGWSMWGTGHGATVRPAGRPLPGQPVPDFKLNLVGGGVFSLAQARGQPVIINFWASWCPACKEEMPALQQLWEEYEGQGVRFVGVAYQDEAAAAQAALAEYGTTYPVGLDEGERIARQYGITGVPETFVIAPDGTLAYLHIGPVTAEQLRADLEAWVK
jgi:cytochrome c-type biogenesis protein CcmF